MWARSKRNSPRQAHCLNHNSPFTPAERYSQGILDSLTSCRDCSSRQFPADQALSRFPTLRLASRSLRHTVESRVSDKRCLQAGAKHGVSGHNGRRERQWACWCSRWRRCRCRCRCRSASALAKADFCRGGKKLALARVRGTIDRGREVNEHNHENENENEHERVY